MKIFGLRLHRVHLRFQDAQTMPSKTASVVSARKVTDWRMDDVSECRGYVTLLERMSKRCITFSRKWCRSWDRINLLSGVESHSCTLSELPGGAKTLRSTMNLELFPTIIHKNPHRSNQNMKWSPFSFVKHRISGRICWFTVRLSLRRVSKTTRTETTVNTTLLSTGTPML